MLPTASTSSPAIRRTGRATVRGAPRRVRRGAFPCTIAIALAACAEPDAASPASPRSTIGPGTALGWLGLAPRPARTSGDWLPADGHAVLVPLPVEGLAAGAALSAVDTTGRTSQVIARAPSKVLYGCDGNQLDVLGFAGGSLAPGVVWLLPPAAPWRPRPVAIASPVTSDEVRRTDTIGPLSLALERTATPTTAVLTIARNGRVLYRATLSRSPMAGANPAPLDLRHPGVAIPTPIAAWSFGDAATILIVFLVPSYEGVRLTALLVESTSARELPALSTYLYRCAF